MPDLPHIKDAIAAGKVAAPLSAKRLTTYGVDDDGNLVELDMRRQPDDRWIVIQRRRNVNG